MGLEENRFNRYIDVVVGGMVRALGATVANSLRQFNLTVGHSTVTSAFLLSFTILAIGVGWTSMMYVLNLPREQARVEEIAANTYRMQLANAEKAQTVVMTPTSPWTMLSLQVRSDGVDFEFRADAMATTALIQWYTPGNVHSGLFEADISATAGQITMVSIPSTEFGAAWAPDDPSTEDREGRILHQSVQNLSDGRQVKYNGRFSNLIMVPGP